MTRAFKSLLVGSFLFLFMGGAALAYVPLKAATIPNATIMKVHIGSGDKAIDANVTDASEISAVIAFINAHVEGWRFVGDTAAPAAEVNLTFFDGVKPVGTFGSDANFFTRGNPVSLTHSAPAKDINDFLNLANIDPAKLAHPPHD